MAEATLATRDVISREEEPSFVIKDPRYVKESTKKLIHAYITHITCVFCYDSTVPINV